jgi:hypothetical protein
MSAAATSQFVRQLPEALQGSLKCCDSGLELLHLRVVGTTGLMGVLEPIKRFVQIIETRFRAVELGLQLHEPGAAFRMPPLCVLHHGLTVRHRDSTGVAGKTCNHIRATLRTRLNDAMVREGDHVRVSGDSGLVEIVQYPARRRAGGRRPSCGPPAATPGSEQFDRGGSGAGIAARGEWTA